MTPRPTSALALCAALGLTAFTTLPALAEST